MSFQLSQNAIEVMENTQNSLKNGMSSLFVMGGLGRIYATAPRYCSQNISPPTFYANAG